MSGSLEKYASHLLYVILTPEEALSPPSVLLIIWSSSSSLQLSYIDGGTTWQALDRIGVMEVDAHASIGSS
jgi:hypothetical protein